MTQTQKRGFTLIELLIVIVIIGFLAAAILVALDPVKRVQDARNAKRWSEVNGVLNAILTKQVDDKALFNGSVALIGTNDSITRVIVATTDGVNCAVLAQAPECPYANGAAGRPAALTYASTTDCVANLGDIAPTYIASIPQDPMGGVAAGATHLLPIGVNNSGYYIVRSASCRIEIGSCHPDQASDVKVKR